MAAAMAIVAATSIVWATPALAHETRMVGPYRFVVGWLNEPAFQGQPNAASVRISDTRDTPPSPVEGVEQTLAIAVVSGGLAETYTRTLRTVFGQPGLYALHMIPTASGAYTYRITGQVEDLEVNETFESGPGRFNEVESASALQYPAKVPVAAELGQTLADLRSTLDQVRLLAIAATLLAVVAVALPLVRPRRA
jgi:hypothetical protein